jgi:hypothetical protein
MRFTWIALPVLLVTLAGASTSAAAPPSMDEKPDHESETDYAVSSSTLPVAAMPSNSGEAQLARLGAAGKVRHDLPLGDVADPLNARPANQIRVRIRTVDRAGFEFIPELTRAVTGFLSSSTTACPPPSSR